MELIITTSLQQYFEADKDLFDQVMALRGEVFRELEGRRTQRITLGNQHYFLKQHFGVGWKEIFKNLTQLRVPILGAKNELVALELLKKLNIPSLQIVAFGQRGSNPASLKSFLLTEELTDVVSLEDFCQHWKDLAPNITLKHNLIRKVAQIARTLHQNGINHRDFYICHFLLCLKSLPQLKLYLIDLHRAQIRSQTPKRWVIKDLAGLYFSSKDIGLTSRDLLRFIREYRKQSLRSLLKTENTFWKQVKSRGDRLYQNHQN